MKDAGFSSDVVEFYFGVASRYSYLASTRLDAIAERHGVRFTWRPIHRPDLYRLRGRSPFGAEPISGEYDWSWRELDGLRWAELYDVPFQEPRRKKIDQRILTLACVAADGVERGEAMARALMRAIFVEPTRRVGRAEVLECASEAGLDRDRLDRALDDPETERQLELLNRRAYECGVFGIPTFVTGGELFWGNDRLPLLEHFLASRG